MFDEIGQGPNGPIQYKLLPEDRIEEVLNVQQESMKREILAIGVGIYEEEGAAEAMKIVFRQVIKDGYTIVAIDVNSDQIIGVSFNKLHVPLAQGEVDPLADVVENCLKPRASLAVVNFLDDVESRVNIFERFGTNAAIEIFYVGTLPGYQGCRIGYGLVERSIQLTKNFANYDLHRDERSLQPGVVFGVFTSNYSQSIASKLNFQWLAVVKYDEYECDGVKMSLRIGKEHQTAKFGALRL